MSRMMRIGLVGATAIGVVAIAQVGRPKNPAGAGDRGGREFRTPPATPAPAVSQQPIRVDSFEVHRVAAGSGLGAPGDVLITFRGRGFTLTATAPRLQLSQGVALEATEVNRDGTELYVLVPRNRLARLDAMQFDSVVVVNPGAREDTEFARRSVRATAARLFHPAPAAPAARLIYRDGAFSRELVTR